MLPRRCRHFVSDPRGAACSACARSLLEDGMPCGCFAFLLPQPVHATLHVIVLDKQEIAITSDGSRTLHTRAELLPVSKTVEKVTKLGSKLAFMYSGLVEIETATVDIRPSEIARLRSV